MSKFFSVDSSWCLTGYCVLMATEVSYYSGAFSVGSPRHFLFQRRAHRCFFYGNLVSWFPLPHVPVVSAQPGTRSSAGECRRASAPVVHLSQTPGEARQPEFAGGSWTQVGMARGVCP